MPSQKKKLKQESKTIVAVAPLQIKSEPLDIKPLSAFVDDRVELIRQAFMSLKPKEIKCLAPDFMDGKSIEFIQEQCLDEVLGISTKRLLSIINSTKCPTDTESSDEDDDGITEHISLDEISSDSEVEIKPVIKSTKSRDKKLNKKAKPIVEQNKKSNQPEAAAGKNGDKKSEKEMTVLELLELQARARAIRSQLALEPVTKIELDSDQESEIATANEQSKEGAPATTNNAVMPTSSTQEEQQTKRIRLKRNFRIRQVGEEDITEESIPEEVNKPEEPSINRKSRSPSKEKDLESQTVEVAGNENDTSAKSRESSPEVIPVIPSPETLCISSDSEDEKERKRKASIFVTNIEELDRQAKEQKDQAETADLVENDEPEEGELSDEDKSPIRTMEEPVENTDLNNKESTINLEVEEELDYEIKEITDSEPDTSVQENSMSKTETEHQTKIDEDRPSTVNENSDESDSDSGSEIEIKNQKQSSSEENDDDDDPDIVEIHDSSDETLLDQKLAEGEQEKSWNSRWLESNRVAKVMAASRLGNKVRDKLKKKKKKQQEADQEAAKQLPEDEPKKQPEEPAAVSSAEVGSVDHYRELLAKSNEAEKEDEITEESH